jgi:hypothetical protein
VLPPYTELIDLDRIRRPDDAALRSGVAALVAEHLARRPRANPVDRLGARVLDDVSWLRENDQDLFHAYAFGTLRQCGAWASCAASFVAWFDPECKSSVEAFDALSSDAKTTQFKLARAAAGRDADLGPLFASMAEHWDEGYRELLERHG